MSCEVEPPRRSLAGRIALAGVGAAALFYLYVATLVAAPDIGESYRRTYVTGEFSILPNADSFGAVDGLAYPLGRRVSLRLDDARKHLARFDWNRGERPLPTLGGFTGRLFVHLPAAGTGGGLPHRLRLGLVCAMPETDVAVLDVAVDGRAIGSALCGRGRVTIDLAIPVGLLGDERYDEITLTRRSTGLGDRIATRLGLRRDAVGLDWFGIDAVDTIPVALDGPAVPAIVPE
jgi:hypothetical protein